MTNEIAIFKINRAEATYENGALGVDLFYPRNPELLIKRLDGNPAYRVKVLKKLLRDGHAKIASEKVPMKPADGGSIYAFSDGVFLVHRRDKGAGVHKLYHSAPGGYTDSLDSTFSEEGLIATGLRESAEENLLVTKDNPPRLIVPNDSCEYTLKAARTLGIELKPRYVDVGTLPSRDRLRVFNEDGGLIFQSYGRGFLDIMWDDSTSFSLMQIRLMPFSSDEVLPIDAEGMMIKGQFKHFNRESYLVAVCDVANKVFGTPLENPRVYQTRFEGGMPIVYTPEYGRDQTPFLGPDGVQVTHPHIWAPENHTTVCLDALGVEGYKGRRLSTELWKNQCKVSGKSMVPEEFLARK